jgi:hypothetical protein
MCKSLSLKPLHGGAEGDRTPDLRIANAALSQLSYSPTQIKPAAASAGTERLVFNDKMLSNTPC